jgi:hypothetical protein
LLAEGEQPERPLDRRSERLLSRPGVAAAPEEVEALGEPIRDLGRGKHACPCSGQLHRQRQVVQAAAQLRDRLVGLDVRTGAEELDCLLRGQRRHRVLDFAGDAQKLAAGHEQTQVGAGGEQS